ncbi:MAG TPA: substrate-binding domain-containing protein [Candidatus Solibacter sp.]
MKPSIVKTRPVLSAVLFASAALWLVSCQKASDAPPAGSFTILAGSELKDIESGLKSDIRAATGIDLIFTYSGTLDAVDKIGAGGHYDALWVSHGKYLAMNDVLKGRILAQEKTMLSPVLLGLKASKARALGWDTAEPTWKDIADAAKAGKFTFGMTNPTSSNTGLTATIGLAAALAKNPDALTDADLKNPRLSDFFNGQRLTSGSSGWLAEIYERDQSKVDGIINYESVLLSLNAGGKLSEPLTLVYPKEGIITADYPLMLLNSSKRADYDKLVAHLRSTSFQTKMSALTLRRPVNADAAMAPAIPKRTLIELPFPGQASLISALLDNFLADVRIPGSSRYVLDLSGSMDGERIAGLKQSMLMLASGTTIGAERYARFQNREEVGIITFSTEPASTVMFPMGSTPDQNAKTRAAITDFVNPLVTGGQTAIFSSIQRALTELGEERGRQRDKRYYTVVLMTDGENNQGLTQAQFKDWYKSQGDSVRGIPVFPILFGEGSPAQLRELADLTGGRIFDSRSSTLAAVFKEIRGYQ